MLWSILFWIISTIVRHYFGRTEVRLISHNPPYEVTPSGPQSWEEAQIAMEALYGNPEGDMRFVSHDNRAGGVGMKDVKYRWPGYPGSPKIPYEIHSSLSSLKSKILKAMDDYHQHTCAKFVPKTSKDKDFVQIIKGDGCWSNIGKVGGKQTLSLGKGCDYHGTIVHELGHTVGLGHEHQRSDRDDHIFVNMTNVRKGFENNFIKMKPADEMRATTYDYTSIMHYGNYAMSRAPKILMTMVAKNGTPLKEPYEKDGLNTKDMDIINKMYQCKK